VVPGYKGPLVMVRETLRKLGPFRDHRGVATVEIPLPDSHDVVGHVSPRATIPSLAIFGAADWHASLDLRPDLWQVGQVRSLQIQWRCNHAAANIDAHRRGNHDPTSENRPADTGALT